MMACTVPGADAPQLQRSLWRRQRVEIPGESFFGAALLRLSVQAYTTDADCERLIAGLRLAVGRRARRS